MPRLKERRHLFLHHVLILLVILLLTGRSLAIVCYHCDSIALPECSQTLGEVGLLPYKECPTELSCRVSIVDSITYRGCGAETPITGSTYTKSCTANLCNGGVYPPGRLKCHHCAGQDCVATPGAKPKPCRYHLEEDQCYTDVLSSSEAYRGCVSEQNHTLSSAAKLCDINGCNEDQGAWTQVCATCDSAEGRGCKMDLFQINTGMCNVTLYEECHQEVLLGEKEDKYCFSFRKLSRVVRGCSTKMPADLAPFLEELEKCRTSDNCNAGCITRQRCLDCNSLDQELCRTNVTAISASTCGSAEASSCFSCEYSNWSMQRGCGAPPTNPDVVKCYECDEEGGCNNKDFTRCYQCSTDQAGAGCANWERPGEIYIEECVEPATSCMVVSFNNGTTARGCQKPDLSCTSANVANCLPCQGSFCNKGAFPEERLWCHQCTGVGDCEEISRGQTALPCPVQANEPEDQKVACLEYFDTHTKQVVRGCRSNSEMYYECLLRSNQHDSCRICHSQACNNSTGKELRASYELETKAMALLEARSSSKSLEYTTVGLGICLFLSVRNL
ncbi:protein psiL [Drosophila suzukii]|uniref:Protein psiL n=1 Tax=Drosophila suzukii TaxID=28584 RepID=A0AB39Z1S4_DROSZ